MRHEQGAKARCKSKGAKAKGDEKWVMSKVPHTDKTYTHANKPFAHDAAEGIPLWDLILVTHGLKGKEHSRGGSSTQRQRRVLHGKQRGHVLLGDERFAPSAGLIALARERNARGQRICALRNGIEKHRRGVTLQGWHSERALVALEGKELLLARKQGLCRLWAQRW